METNKSKNNIKYKASRPKRFFALELIIFIVFFILLIKIAYWQFIQGSYLKEQATKQHTTSRVLSAKRGSIYDSTGTALAISADVDTVTINPQKFVKDNNNETKELQEKIATKLSEIFELDYQETLTKVCSTNSVETIVQKVEKNKISELQKWMEKNKISARYKY